ncbi:hypothetical protein [Streptomyces sp. NBC_00134]|uniref:hypothetical protein n=1 Tax=Streptomyces sp. NBC_00134 TaxID=2975663 RepID=UPI002F919E51
MKTRDGRRLLTRRELADEHGLSVPTLERLWAKRDDNDHPEPAEKDGRTLYWDAAEWAAWHAKLNAPADEIGPAEFARILDHKHTKWVSEAARSSTPPQGFPVPDRWEEGPRGRRPIWQRARAQQYADTPGLRAPRAGAGRPAGRSRVPYLYAGDERLTLARQVLAEHPDESNAQLIDRLEQLADTTASRSTWTKILATARHTTEEE